VAQPLRFRRSSDHWSEGRVRSAIYHDLDGNLGARMLSPWYAPPDGYRARRFEMTNGDVALFCWGESAYWLGNTETPSALWRTEKVEFTEAPASVARWAEREFLAQLHEESPWLAEYPTLSWFFLPVLLSKDGRDSTRTFLREHAAGFPDTSSEDALEFFERFLGTGALDDHRYVMASKLGTSKQVDPVRMSASMGEFIAAKLLVDAGFEVTPEIEVTTGHCLDFRADPPDGSESTLVEVTRPQPARRRAAGTPAQAVRQTAETKTSGQLQKHGGGVVLFVDCSSFPDDAWAAVKDEQPSVGHRPAVVFRVRPSGRLNGYHLGSDPLGLGAGLE